MRPIGWVVGGREVVEDDDWGAVTARIELDLEVCANPRGRRS